MGSVLANPPARPIPITAYLIDGTCNLLDLGGYGLGPGQTMQLQLIRTVGAALDVNKFRVVNVIYPMALAPMQASVADGVEALSGLVATTPGPFVLITYSQGGMVASSFYMNELRSLGGALHDRLDDLIAVVNFANPCRETGHTVGIANYPDPGGHGVMLPAYEMTDSPDWWWDFANGPPQIARDLVTALTDGPSDSDLRQLFGLFYQDFTGQGLLSFIIDGLATLVGMTVTDPAALLNTIVEFVQWAAFGAHAAYMTAAPIPDNPKSSMQLAIDYLTDVGNQYHAVRETPLAPPTTQQVQLALYEQMMQGDLLTLADAAEKLAELNCRPDPEWIFTLHDKFWRPIGEFGDFIESSGTDPRNALPSATLKNKGDCEHIAALMNCRNTMVGITVETGGLRWAYYVDTHEYEYTDRGEWTSTANCLGIWDILNYLQIWPDWFLPIQAQLFSHAIFIGPIRTCIEAMIAECALRIQSGMWEFVNNALSLNPDFRAWFGTLLQSNGNVFTMLKTPIYVVMHNPFLDTSPLIARTVRMESCGSVIKDITKAYGIDVRVDLWKPGDAQPDQWAGLTQPTYVVIVKDRSQITGPTQTVLDSVIRTLVDAEGALLGHVMDPILNPTHQYVPDGMFSAPAVGVNFHAPWVMFIAPEPGDVGSVTSCKIVDHTPKGWQHIIGGRSPKWLNDLINVTFSWIIDAISILIGITGIPSDLLSGFLNDSFLSFQLMEHYERRDQVGPYHPAIEVFHATTSAPYNIETEFAFVNALWDSRGWTCAQLSFRNGEVYTVGKDIFRGALASVVYMGRTRILTDYVENIMWKIDAQTRDVLAQVGDGKAIESPLAKQQRLITGALEAINVVTLAPQSG